MAARAGLTQLTAPAWVRTVEAHPDTVALRADAYRNLMAVVWAMAPAIRPDKGGTTAPTWAALVERTGLNRSTVAKWLAWLQAPERRLLLVVETGSTPQTRPGASAVTGNHAAVYLPVRPLTAVELVERGGWLNDVSSRSSAPRRPRTDRPRPTTPGAPTRPAEGRSSAGPCLRPPSRRPLAHGSTAPSCPVDESRTPPLSKERGKTNHPLTPFDASVTVLEVAGERLRRDERGSSRGPRPSRLAAAVQRRGHELTDAERSPYLDRLLGLEVVPEVDRYALTAAIRRAGLADLEVDELVHAVRFAPDGREHLATGTPRDPVGVLSWRLGLWGAFIAAVGVDRAFTVRRELDDRRDVVRRRRRERAAETAGRPMPSNFRELAAAAGWRRSAS